MDQEIKTFVEFEIEKHKLHRNKNLFLLEDVDTYNKLASNKISSGKKNCKYFIAYLYDDYKVKPLLTMLLTTSAYVRSYDGQTEWMHFLIEDDHILKKHSNIWDKVSADIKKELHRELI